jgi:hypothetical protein
MNMNKSDSGSFYGEASDTGVPTGDTIAEILENIKNLEQGQHVLDDEEIIYWKKQLKIAYEELLNELNEDLEEANKKNRHHQQSQDEPLLIEEVDGEVIANDSSEEEEKTRLTLARKVISIRKKIRETKASIGNIEEEIDTNG